MRALVSIVLFSLFNVAHAEEMVNRKTLLYDGVYAPVFSEFRYLSPTQNSKLSRNYTSFGARCGFQFARTQHVAATLGMMGQTTLSPLLAYWGPNIDFIAFPKSPFQFGLSAMVGKGRLKRFDPGAAASSASNSRFPLTATEGSLYGVYSFTQSVQLSAGVTRLDLRDASPEAFMLKEGNEDPSGLAFSVALRVSKL